MTVSAEGLPNCPYLQTQAVMMNQAFDRIARYQQSAEEVGQFSQAVADYTEFAEAVLGGAMIREALDGDCEGDHFHRATTAVASNMLFVTRFVTEATNAEVDRAQKLIDADKENIAVMEADLVLHTLSCQCLIQRA